MTKLNYRAGVFTFLTTLALNGVHLLAYFNHVKHPAVDVLARFVGWGVDLPGMLAVFILGRLGIPLFWQADAVSSELLVFGAMAVLSGFIWFIAAGLIFRKKPNQSAHPTLAKSQLG